MEKRVLMKLFKMSFSTTNSHVNSNELKRRRRRRRIIILEI